MADTLEVLTPILVKQELEVESMIHTTQNLLESTEDIRLHIHINVDKIVKEVFDQIDNSFKEKYKSISVYTKNINLEYTPRYKSQVDGWDTKPI